MIIEEGVFHILQQNIKSGLRISQNNLIQSSILYGIKILWESGITDIKAFEQYRIRMSQDARPPARPHKHTHTEEIAF